MPNNRGPKGLRNRFIYEGYGESPELPSGVLGRTPAENAFYIFCKMKINAQT